MQIVTIYNYFHCIVIKLCSKYILCKYQLFFGTRSENYIILWYKAFVAESYEVGLLMRTLLSQNQITVNPLYLASILFSVFMP